LATIDSLVDRYQFHFHLTFDVHMPKTTTSYPP
jgi:hypothetical protein